MTKSEDKAATVEIMENDDVVLSGKSRNVSKAINMLDPEIFGDVKIELTATLGRGEMTVSELANLVSDAVVPLDTPINGMVDLKFNGRVVARGEIVSVGDQFGVRITEIVARKL